jgi:NTP pyrophosphatase (non-canonical NTP hydrolase)
MKRVTLEGIANKCEEMQYGLSMTKQSLHGRLKGGKIEIEKLLGETIKLKIEKRIEKQEVAKVLDEFESVEIIDSTIITLPNKLEKDHKGLGGRNSKSSMKIQGNYNIKEKDFKRIEIINNGTKSDSSYVEELVKDLDKNGLVIMDLGYYGVKNFKMIEEKEGYFISKIKINTNIYKTEKKTEKIGLKNELKNKNEIDEKVVIRGQQGKWMEVRLVGIKLPEKVYNEKIRKARNTAKPKGKTLTKETLERLKWVLMVTNVESEKLDVKAITEIYRIRWQIELIFKTWKSYFAIDEMNNIGKDYLDCLILGKLVVITLLNCMYSHLYYEVNKDIKRQISYMRFMKNMREELGVLIDYVAGIGNGLSESLENSINRVINSSLTEKRNRKTTEQSICSLHLPQESLKIAC